VEWFVAHNIATLAQLIQNALQQREKESSETQMHYSTSGCNSSKMSDLKGTPARDFCITNIADTNTVQYVWLYTVGSPVLQQIFFVLRNSIYKFVYKFFLLITF
jgi:hypothetical protein